MFLQPTDEWEVAKIRKQMKNKRSYGLAGISKEILKCCSPVIEPAIAAALNKCIEERTFPNVLQTSSQYSEKDIKETRKFSVNKFVKLYK